MTTLVTRSGKGSALSHNEMDTNWQIAVPDTVVKSGAYTIVATDEGDMVLVDASGGAITITLLAAATAGDGFSVIIKKTDSSSNAVTIDGNASETIDGSTTLALDTQYESVMLVCDGSNWHVHSSKEFITDPLPIAEGGSGAQNGGLEENAQTGTSYTLVLADAGKIVSLTNAAAITLTVPPNASVAYSTGTMITLRQGGAGQVTITEGAGVTINNVDSHTKIKGQYGYVSIRKTDTDTWESFGATE